jgi:endonuclease YncB( thermonuclease family)
VICAISIALLLSSCAKNEPIPEPTVGELDHVIDGNTLAVLMPAGVIEPVRLIGVHISDEEASRRAAIWLGGVYDKGFPLLLTFDSITRDKDGRLLAYVFAGKGTEGVSPEEVEQKNAKSRSMHAVMLEGRVYGFVNASLIKGGRAQPAQESRNRKYADLFRELHEVSIDRR